MTAQTPPPTRHTDRTFESELEQLRERLRSMSAKVEQQISASMEALTERDRTLAQAVIDGDAEVNRRELEIDALCHRILALRQPAASDLRLITTALKIVTDLERIGDLAGNIAERALDLSRAPTLPVMNELLQLAAEADAQVQRAQSALANEHRAR